jgi:hypothetical protein
MTPETATVITVPRRTLRLLLRPLQVHCSSQVER